jgi:thiamine pyrophosphate-dependent acetolactate synthase large subunit-like protein
VAGLGNTCFDLAAFDRPLNFYMLNSMGQAASIGLGLALAQPQRRVIVLDGDGSVLMNLQALATQRMAEVANLVEVIWDNGGWEITGGQPAATACGVDLEQIARACGIARAATVDDLDAFEDVFQQAMADTQAWVIVAKVASGNSTTRPDLHLVELKARFKAALAPR